METLDCRQCNRPFEARPGRGGRSPYCPDCQSQRRADLTAMRRLRQETAALHEFVEVFGPLVIQWRREIGESQEGRCKRCGKARRLYFARDDLGALIGVCVDCQQRKEPHD